MKKRGRVKNCKKAYDSDGKLKSEYTIKINNLNIPLLSIKGNFINKNTKNAKTRKNKIVKTNDSINEYINFLNNKLGTDFKLVKKDYTTKNGKVSKILNKKFAKGGLMVGNSHSEGGIPMEVKNSDDVELEGGEYVIKKSSVNKIGVDNLHKINKTGKLPSGGYKGKYIYQEQINLITELDFDSIYKSMVKSTKKSNKSKMMELSRTIVLKYGNKIRISELKISEKDSIKLIYNQFIELKSLVKAYILQDEMNKRNKKKPNSVGVLVDFESLFGQTVNVDALKRLLTSGGVINSGGSSGISTGGSSGSDLTTSGMVGKIPQKIIKPKTTEEQDSGYNQFINDTQEKKKREEKTKSVQIKKYNVLQDQYQNSSVQFDNLMNEKKDEFVTSNIFRIKKNKVKTYRL